ncbi:MAG: dynamin family protein [Chloroflexi bacterium]|nr:dynamin family protein [Chloroflexota bacterium]
MTVQTQAGPMQILDERQQGYLSEEQALLGQLREALLRFEAAPEDLAVLRQAVGSLADLFLLVIVGEFNSGKSTFINALLGQRVMPEGVTPTTQRIHILRYGSEAGERMVENEIIIRTFPAEFLHQISVVDTPGTNSIIRRHQEISEEFVPRSDLVLFVTSADRPFTESERVFLEKVRAWGKKIIVILNKTDLLETQAERDKILSYIRENAAQLLGLRPEIFPVAARKALRLKLRAGQQPASQQPAGQQPETKKPENESLANHSVSSGAAGEPATADGQKATILPGDERDWEESGFGALEAYIFETLDEESRVRLKLLNPLGVAERLVSAYHGMAQQRLNLLAEDMKTIENIEAQLQIYRQDMETDFANRLSRIENLIHEMDNRAEAFFETYIRLTQVRNLINTEKISQQFEEEVVADTADRIEHGVQDLIDWMVDRELRMWQSIMDYVNRRRQVELKEGLIGEVGGSFDYNRRELLQSVGGAALQVVDSYDRQAEADELALNMRDAVAQTAITGVGAVGLGTAIALMVGTAAADVTGILAASMLAGLGLFILPWRRNQARVRFHADTEELRGRLTQSLRQQFETEMDRSQERIREAVAPYTRFVRSQNERIGQIEASMQELEGQMRDLRSRIEMTG